MSNDAVLDMVRAADIPVCTLGCEYGWLFATGDESTRLFDVLEEPARTRWRSTARRSCARRARTPARCSDAIENLKRGADICGKFGLTLAIEFNSQHAVINSIAALREILDGAAGRTPACCSTPITSSAAARAAAASPTSRRRRSPRSSTAMRRRRRSRPASSDRPTGCRRARDRALDRGARLLNEKRFDGHLSYEAPNPAQWERSPFDVAREGAAATRALIAKALN